MVINIDNIKLADRIKKEEGEDSLYFKFLEFFNFNIISKNYLKKRNIKQNGKVTNIMKDREIEELSKMGFTLDKATQFCNKYMDLINSYIKENLDENKTIEEKWKEFRDNALEVFNIEKIKKGLDDKDLLDLYYKLGCLYFCYLLNIYIVYRLYK